MFLPYSFLLVFTVLPHHLLCQMVGSFQLENLFTCRNCGVKIWISFASAACFGIWTHRPDNPEPLIALSDPRLENRPAKPLLWFSASQTLFSLCSRDPMLLLWTTHFPCPSCISLSPWEVSLCPFHATPLTHRIFLSAVNSSVKSYWVVVCLVSVNSSTSHW